MAKKTVVDSVLDYLKSIDGAEFLHVSGRKHAKIWWAYRGEKRVTVTSRTASDHRAHENAKAVVRQQIEKIKNA